MPENFILWALMHSHNFAKDEKVMVYLYYYELDILKKTKNVSTKLPY